MSEGIIFYLLFMNLAAFSVFSIDKFRAINSKSRISELELHTFSLIGGFLGSSVSMIIFRHKTSKSSFLSKHILIISIWILGAVTYFTKIDELIF